MGLNTLFTKALPGIWVQVAEYKPGRTSLIIEYLAGVICYLNRTDAPTTQTPFGDGPAGLLYANLTEPIDDKFEIDTKTHAKDLVEAAWYAWIFPAYAPRETIFNGNSVSGTVDVPADATNVKIRCRGVCGGSWDADPVAGPSGGGGGPALVESANFAMGGLTTLTCHVEPGVPPNTLITANPNWISRTGVIPVIEADGVLARSGANGAQPGAPANGIGGSALTSIGVTKHAGGNGGDVAAFFPGVGGSGGGGGGSGTLTAGGTNGTIGVGGPATLTPGGFEGGGQGGASDGIESPDGNVGGGGGNGGSGITAPGVAGLAPTSGAGGWAVWYDIPVGSIITTIEAFDPQPQYDPREAQPDEGTFTVQLPSLTPEAVAHLRSLRRKIDGQRGIKSEDQDPAEYD